jgi:hypothetical protein
MRARAASARAPRAPKKFHQSSKDIIAACLHQSNQVNTLG